MNDHKHHWIPRRAGVQSNGEPFFEMRCVTCGVKQDPTQDVPDVSAPSGTVSSVKLTGAQLDALHDGIDAIREAAIGMFDLKSLSCTVVLTAEREDEADLTVHVVYAPGGWQIDVTEASTGPTGLTESRMRAVYCSVCQHPRSYHDLTRGCTMPLDGLGDPVMRNQPTASLCGCKGDDQTS